MRQIVKQVAATDVSQRELVVSLGRMYDDWTPEIYASKTFINNKKGYAQLLSWVEKLTDPSTPVRYIMEATGVYHESFSYFLASKDRQVSIILPNKISNYFRTLEVKTITDRTAAEAIARFGLERKLDTWKPAKGLFKRLKELTRERDQLIAERTVLKNQLHAEETKAEPSTSAISRIKIRIHLLKQQDKEIRDEVLQLVNQDKETKESVNLISSVSGIGLLTAVIILAETNGFELIRNKRQLISYAGLDIKEKQSGTSVKGKPKISKKGNRHLRKAMHLPALTAIKHDNRFKAVFARIVACHGIKMKAVVAIQRKLLEMAYIIYKTGKKYDKNYFDKPLEIQKELDYCA